MWNIAVCCVRGVNVSMRCHSERSEEALFQILRFVQDDSFLVAESR